MNPVGVCGFFAITMEVVDGTNPVSLIDQRATNLRHLIHLENISGHPADGYVRAILPHGQIRLEFDVFGNWWDGYACSIPAGGARTLESGLKRNGGPPGKQEPLQCHQLWAKYGSYGWNRLTANLPFDIYVDVS